MTRLTEWAKRVTREMLKEWCGAEGAIGADATAALLEREVRELVAKAADQYVGAAMTEVWLNEPATPPTEQGERLGESGAPGAGPVKCKLYDANCPEPQICEVEGACCAGDADPRPGEAVKTPPEPEEKP